MRKIVRIFRIFAQKHIFFSILTQFKADFCIKIKKVAKMKFNLLSLFRIILGWLLFQLKIKFIF